MCLHSWAVIVQHDVVALEPELAGLAGKKQPALEHSKHGGMLSSCSRKSAWLPWHGVTTKLDFELQVPFWA